MDPNANLAEIRRIIDRAGTESLTTAQADRLVELFEALDGWISRGGFLPRAWERNDGPAILGSDLKGIRFR